MKKLVIAEKPSVARTIAAVLGVSGEKNGYMENDEYVVSWCLGHLAALAPPESYGGRYAEKPWKFENLPIIPLEWKLEINKSTEKQYEIVQSLLNRYDVSEVICATDAGREGECIFRYVYKLAQCEKPVKRLWTSSLEESAIRKSFEDMKDGSFYDSLYAAGLSRAKADWLVGMNATRLFSIRHKTTLPIGRVQTPTLAMIVQRDYQAKNFVKEKFFTVELLCGEITATSPRMENETDAQALLVLCDGKQAVVSDVKQEAKTKNPPKLYDLTTLQREANRLMGYTAQQTLDYAQSLYEAKLLTYPRTDSQYITDDMEQTALDVIQTVCNVFPVFVDGKSFTPSVTRLVNNAKVSDHHAIIPTSALASANISQISDGERNILSLVSSRLLLASSLPFKFIDDEVTVCCEGKNFVAKGRRVIDEGYRYFEKRVLEQCKSKASDNDRKEEKALPELKTGIIFPRAATNIKEHWTSPPKQFTEDTLLSAMETAGNENYDEKSDVEKKGLGTPATRAGIIENLVKRELVRRDGKKLTATEKGKSLIDVVPEEVKSPKMTADWESALQNIEKGKAAASDFTDNVVIFIKDLISKYGSYAENNSFGSGRAEIGTCPICGKRVLEYPKAFSCSSGKDGCGFVIWKEICKKRISSIQAQKLLTNGKTSLIKNFQSKAGKTFDAYLKLNPDSFAVELEFPSKK